MSLSGYAPSRAWEVEACEHVSRSLIYVLLNIFFFVFHTVLILFNLLGWIWRKTRLANLVTLSLTGFSWFVLGLWYGFGYCPSTDWHWLVRLKLGYTNMPSSYIKFLVDQITGLSVNAQLVDRLTLLFFLLAVVGSVVTNLRDWQRRARVGRE
jgi:hypothetical protein